MHVIWKAELAATEAQMIDVPRGAELLCAREQNEAVCVWFRCDPSEALEKRQIIVCGTGHGAPSEQSGRYLGSAHLQGGALVFHVFEKIA